jgi:putative spermidine/putrescine transport system permease protein
MIKRYSTVLMLLPALLVLSVLLVLPVGYLLSFSVLAEGTGPQIPNAFTSANYARLFTDAYYLSLFGRTLWLSALTSVIAAVTGTCFAWFMWQSDRRWRGPLTILILSPLLVSIVVTSYGWVVILGRNGAVNAALQAIGLVSAPLQLMHNDFAIVVGLVHVVIPFMVLSVLAALERIEAVLGEAAMTLGAQPWRVLWHVILPLAMPGIAAGTTIVFCLSLSAYVTPAVLGGSGPNFVTTLIYDLFITRYDWPFGSAVAAVLLVTALASVSLYLRLLNRLGAQA